MPSEGHQLYHSFRSNIEHVHEQVWCKKYDFWHNASYENLDQFFLYNCMYSIGQSTPTKARRINPILHIHNVEILNICMKEIVKHKFFSVNFLWILSYQIKDWQLDHLTRTFQNLCLLVWTITCQNYVLSLTLTVGMAYIISIAYSFFFH